MSLSFLVVRKHALGRLAAIGVHATEEEIDTEISDDDAEEGEGAV